MNKPVLEEKILLNINTKDKLRKSRIYSISFDYFKKRIIIESDFIVSWLEISAIENLKTWQVPAFIIFENVFNMNINIDWDKDYLDITIDEIYYEESNESKVIMEIGDFDLGKIMIESMKSPVIHLIGEPILCEGSEFEKTTRDEIINSNIELIRAL